MYTARDITKAHIEAAGIPSENISRVTLKQIAQELERKLGDKTVNSEDDLVENVRDILFFVFPTL